MNRVFREEKKFLLSQAEALAVGHRLEQIMLPDPHNGALGLPDPVAVFRQR